MTADLAIDLASLPARWARLTRDGIVAGDWRPAELGLGVDVATGTAAAAAVAIPLRDCVLQRVQLPADASRPSPVQLEQAVRFQLASALRADVEAISAAWTATPTGVVAAGALTETARARIAPLEAGGIRVHTIEPASSALLRVLCADDPAVIVAVLVAGKDAELVVGSGTELHLARQCEWSTQGPEGLGLEIEDTLRMVAADAAVPRPEAVVLAGTPLVETLEEMMVTLGTRLSAPLWPLRVVLGEPHARWRLRQVAPADLVAVGALLDPIAPSTVRPRARRRLLPSLRTRRKKQTAS